MLAPAGLADLVTGSADALQAAGHRAWRLDLDDEVDGAHVDAQLEAAGRHQRPQVAPLQLVLDLQTTLPAQRAVVGLDQFVTGGRRSSLGLGRPRFCPPGASSLSRVARRSARRRALTNTMVEWCSLDQLEQPRVHRRPDRAAYRAGGGGALDWLVDDLTEAAHVLDGDHDLDLHRLAHPGVDDGDRPRRAVVADRRGTGRSRRGGVGWPTGRCAGAGVSHRSSSRSRVRARWEPRLVAARAWISSMITVSTPARVSRAADVSMR